MAPSGSASEADLHKQMELLTVHLQSLQMTHTFLADRLELERKRAESVQSQVSSPGPESSSMSSSTVSNSGRRTRDEEDSYRSMPEYSMRSNSGQSGIGDAAVEDDEPSRARAKYRSATTTYVVEDDIDDELYDDDLEVDLSAVTYRSCSLDPGEEVTRSVGGLGLDDDDLLAALEYGAPAPTEPSKIDLPALTAIVEALGALAKQGAASEQAAVEVELARLSATMMGGKAS